MHFIVIGAAYQASYQCHFLEPRSPVLALLRMSSGKKAGVSFERLQKDVPEAQSSTKTIFLKIKSTNRPLQQRYRLPARVDVQMANPGKCCPSLEQLEETATCGENNEGKSVTTHVGKSKEGGLRRHRLFACKSHRKQPKREKTSAAPPLHSGHTHTKPHRERAIERQKWDP